MSIERKPERQACTQEVDSNPEEEEWVTIKDAAERSGYRVDTIRKIIGRGRIPAERREVEYLVKREIIHVPFDELMRYKLGPKDKGGRPRKHPE